MSILQLPQTQIYIKYAIFYSYPEDIIIKNNYAKYNIRFL